MSAAYFLKVPNLPPSWSNPENHHPPYMELHPNRNQWYDTGGSDGWLPGSASPMSQTRHNKGGVAHTANRKQSSARCSKVSEQSGGLHNGSRSDTLWSKGNVGLRPKSSFNKK